MAQDDYTLFKPSDSMRDLQLWEEIERNPRISQRELSHKFGIALGVTNACIKRMARRGLIRLKGFSPRRIAYYLTPKGFAEKSKLMLHFFCYNIQRYAEMKKLISKKLLEMQQGGAKWAAFFGVSGEMEIAYITLQGSDMRLVGIADEDGGKQGARLLGNKVLSLGEVKGLNPDVILVTSMREQPSYMKSVAKQKDCNRIKMFTI